MRGTTPCSKHRPTHTIHAPAVWTTQHFVATPPHKTVIAAAVVHGLQLYIGMVYQHTPAHPHLSQCVCQLFTTSSCHMIHDHKPVLLSTPPGQMLIIAGREGYVLLMCCSVQHARSATCMLE
jgi:hypothetical protein